MKFLAFLVMVAFNPLSALGATAPRWIVLGAAAGILAFMTPALHWTRVHTALVAWVAWAAATYLHTNLLVFDYVASLGVLALILAVFVYSAEKDCAEDVFVGATYGLGVNLVFSFLQANGYSFWGEFSPPAGLFSNRNYLAETAAIVLVGLIVYKRFGMTWLPASVIALSWSRTALLALVAVGWVALFRKNKFAAIVLLGVVGASVPLMIKHSPNSAAERVQIWNNTYKHVTWTGSGLGMFAQVYPLMSNTPTLKERPSNAHNDYLEIAYETGVIGLLLFLGVVGTTLLSGSVAAYPMVALFVIAFFSFPLALPATVFLFACVAGTCARDWRLGRRVTDGGGVFLRDRVADDEYGTALYRAQFVSVVPGVPQGPGVFVLDERRFWKDCGLAEGDQRTRTDVKDGPAVERHSRKSGGVLQPVGAQGQGAGDSVAVAAAESGN